MHTLELQGNNKIYINLMWFLGRFSKDEIQIEEESDQYISTRQYLEKELKTLKKEKLSILVLNN